MNFKKQLGPPSSLSSSSPFQKTFGGGGRIFFLKEKKVLVSCREMENILFKILIIHSMEILELGLKGASKSI